MNSVVSALAPSASSRDAKRQAPRNVALLSHALFVPVYAVREPEDLPHVASLTKPSSSQPFGQFLLEHGLLTPEDLEEILAMQRNMHGRRIGWVSQTLGIFDELALGRLLAAHHGIACVSLPGYHTPSDLRSRVAGIPKCGAVSAILHEDEDAVWLAVADVTDASYATEVAATLGKPVHVVMACAKEIADFAHSDRRNGITGGIPAVDSERLRQQYLQSRGLPVDTPLHYGFGD